MGFVTRASWSLVMIFSFLFVIVYGQQNGCVVLVFILQCLMYHELLEIGVKPEREAQLSLGTRLLGWYWFFVSSLLLYGAVLEKHLVVHSMRLRLGMKQLRYYQFSAFVLYISGLVAFVLTLKHKQFRYQFERFALAHVVILLVVAQTSALIYNMFEGLVWFLLPCSLVICNDIWAYIFGFFFGRTPLIRLSPKKTWEGFLGGMFATFVWGLLFSRLLVRFPLMTCPRLGFKLEYWPTCATSPVFSLVQQSSSSSISLMPMDYHVLALALFASLIAPFGGFFASGFKRAFNVKDFGSSIPGHGGITDRMDCQVMMGMFVFVYLRAIVLSSDSNTLNFPNAFDYTTSTPVTEGQLTALVNLLSNEHQLQLFNQLKVLLQQKGISETLLTLT